MRLKLTIYVQFVSPLLQEASKIYFWPLKYSMFPSTSLHFGGTEGRGHNKKAFKNPGSPVF